MEAENCKEIMSKPTDFNQYMLKRGQKRGAESSGMFSLFGGNKVDESGQEDTTQEVGKFKALITITRKGEEFRKKAAINDRLTKIRKLINDIAYKYTKNKSEVVQL
jgi:hypothetical protein